MSKDAAATERADTLSAEAAQSIANKDLVRAANLAREALSIDHDHERAKTILQSLQQESSTSQLPELCLAFAEHGDEATAKEALEILEQHPRLTDQEGRRCVQELLSHPRETTELLDDLTGALLSASKSARQFLAARLTVQPRDTFLLLWNRGGRSFGSITTTVLDKALWNTPTAQEKAVREIFQLAMSQLIAPQQDCTERAMTCVARLLASEPVSLLSVIDSDTFEVIAPFLDVRLPASTRSQATLAMVKLLEMTKGTGQQHLEKFVRSHVDRGSSDDLVVAFSAATAAFPIVPQAAAELFLAEGFLPNLIAMVRRDHESGSDTKSHQLQRAALELFSAACIDKACREAVSKHALTWLEDLAVAGSDAENSGLAALVLSKISQTETEGHRPQDVVQLTTTLMNMTLNATNEFEKQSSIEGMAYTSLDPKVKETIADRKEILDSIKAMLRDEKSSSSVVYGCYTILANITTYRPKESEEEKRVSQLKAYANASKPSAESELEDDAHVTSRCRKVLDSGMLPEMIRRGKSPTAAVLVAVIQILHSLAKEQKHRGILAQNGVVRYLLQIISRTESQSADVSTPASSIQHTAAHTLARILISANPNHAFSSSMPALSALRPLVGLLKPDQESSTRSLLPTFESLLALTNLASMDDDSIQDSIIRTSWSLLEDLLLNSNTLIQRASVELVCNLMASPHGVALFADGSKAAGNRMHILLALADAEDLATRRASGGALAMLTEWDEAVKAVLNKDRGIKIILGMCDDDSDEVRHRGVVCLLNIVSAPGEVGQQGLKLVKAEKGDGVLRKALRGTKNPQVLQIGVEVLKKIMGQ